MSTDRQTYTLATAPAAETNPFMEGEKINNLPVKRKNTNFAQKANIFTPATKEQIGSIDGFYSRMEVDATQYIKLYLEGVGALKKLSPAGLTVFQIFYAILLNQIGKDEVTITSAIAMSRFKLDRNTYQRGMADLINARFIWKTKTPGIFWVNPEYVFNGERLRFVQDYDRKEANAARVIKATAGPLTLKGKANEPSQTDLEEAIRDAEKENGR